MPSAAKGNERHELWLLERYRNDNDLQAREELVARMQPMVRSVVRRYRDRGIATDDLMQAANLGLVKAIDGFDVDRGHRFVSYVMPTMQGEVKRHFRDHAWSVHVPRSVKELHGRVMRRAQTPSAATTDELRTAGHQEGLEPQEVDEVLLADQSYRALSLDAPIGASADADTTPTRHLGVDEPGYRVAEDRATIETAMDRIGLTDRERRIMDLRYREDLNQNEIARDIGVSQMQISRVLRSILDRLASQGAAWSTRSAKGQRERDAA